LTKLALRNIEAHVAICYRIAGHVKETAKEGMGVHVTPMPRPVSGFCF
jgi:hypothetical protein